MSDFELKDNKLYLLHILECLDRIDEYVNGDPSIILSDRMVSDAVLRNLQVLGESTKFLSDDIKAKHPDTNWRGISGFRNQLVHNYFGVDEERVLRVIQNDLPPLRAVIALALAHLE